MNSRSANSTSSGVAAGWPAIGFILRSYPRLSQTFILQEILALERIGVPVRIYAITNPHEPIVQSEVGRVRAPVRYLEAARGRSTARIILEHLAIGSKYPYRYLKTLGYVLLHAEIDRGYTGASRFECFLQAVYLARLIDDEEHHGKGPISRLHAHFAHDPTLIALLVHMIRGTPYSFTAHARDLYQIPRRALIERVERAAAVVTCCAANVQYIDRVLPPDRRKPVALIHHGVDLDRFAPLPGRHFSPGGQPPLILSAGRLVEKKGFPDLLRACALLKQEGYSFRCEIYGEGPMREALQAEVDRLGLGGEVALGGPLKQEQLASILRGADIFALTPFVTKDGDRDGVPNVLVEAMACGLPVVSTNVGGIPELVRGGDNGLLVAPRDIKAIAGALAALLDGSALPERLGAAARQTVVEYFDSRAAARQLALLFGRALEQRSTQVAPVTAGLEEKAGP